ncbi:MAG: tripartite tricarboxylate transporter substrate binding protein [Casimicrobiaceae bacterium]
MNRLRRTLLRYAGGALGIATLGLGRGARAEADSFPNRPVRMIIPYPPGGAGDIVGRLLGAKMGSMLNQSIIIDNRGGGAQVIATELTAQAPPDGYTVLLASTTHSINPALRKLPYDTFNDFTSITLVASSPLVFVAHPSLGVSTIQQLVAKAKQEPGKINYGSSGPGTGGHLSVELLKSMAGIDMTHIPYKGATPALTDLLAGRVQIVCTSPLPAMPHVESGRLRALALTSVKRSPLWPDLPTVAESGYPTYQSTLWYALIGPAHLSANVVTALNESAVRALRSADVLEQLRRQGADAVGDSPQELDAFLHEEVGRWSRLIKTAHITVTE